MNENQGPKGSAVRFTAPIPLLVRGRGAGDEPRGWGIRWSQVSLLTKH